MSARRRITRAWCTALICAEILPNTSAEETAVCNLGSVNLTARPRMALNQELIAQTVRTAVRCWTM